MKLLILTIILIPALCWGETPSAIHSIQKLERMCASGISYNKFNDIYADTQAEADLFIKSYNHPNEEYKQSVTGSVWAAITAYRNVRIIWSEKFNYGGVTSYLSTRSQAGKNFIDAFKDLDSPSHRDGVIVSRGFDEFIDIDLAVIKMMGKAKSHVERMVDIYTAGPQVTP